MLLKCPLKYLIQGTASSMLKMAIRPLFRLFSSFQTNITIFTTNVCEKCPSSTWCWDLNPQPSDLESPPITTRPGRASCILCRFVRSGHYTYTLMESLILKLN